MKKVNHSENLGKKFGRLTVLEVILKGKYYYYNCLCDCGNPTSVTSFSVINGKQVSCGCYRIEQTKKAISGKPNINRKDDGTPSFRYLLWTYKRNAKKRGIEFSLTDEQFKEITKRNCKYCNQPPTRPVKYSMHKRNKELYNYDNAYLHNGIDRKDNNKGYTLDNSVPCCRTCNVAKGTQTIEEFKQWIERAYKHGIR